MNAADRAGVPPVPEAAAPVSSEHAFPPLSGRTETVVTRHHGAAGRRITFTQNAYVSVHRQHLVLFDALLVIGRRLTWHGELDLTLDEEALVTITRELHVLPRELAPSSHELERRLGGYVYWTDGQQRLLGDTIAAEFERRDGRIRPRREPASPSRPDPTEDENAQTPHYRILRNAVRCRRSLLGRRQSNQAHGRPLLRSRNLVGNRSSRPIREAPLPTPRAALQR